MLLAASFGKRQLPCTHTNLHHGLLLPRTHHILTTAEVTAFVAQFWDQKMHPTKASQHKFLATRIDVDVQKNVKYNNYEKYTIKRGHRTKYFVPYRGMCRDICKIQFLHYFKISKFVVESVAKTKAAAFLKRRFYAYFKKYTHTPPPR